MMYLLLIIGFVLLIKGADFFVEGSSTVAKLLKVPSVVIGLTVVAMGTSAPEAAVSITAGLSGNNDIALNNVIGSNIFNLLVVIGACAIICGVRSNEDIMKRDMPVNILSTIVVLVMILDHELSRIEGIVLLIMMAVYLAVVVKSAIKNRVEVEEEETKHSPLVSIVLGVIGIGAIILGGDLVVDSACDIAAAFGVSEGLIGLTIIAVGTSLPELVTSIVAAGKGEDGLALGNAVGSCIFNMLFILGISASLSPIAGTRLTVIDMIVLLGVTLFLAIVSKTKDRTNRIEGILCVGAYVIYMIYAVMR